jgi:hypothetical protein
MVAPAAQLLKASNWQVGGYRRLWLIDGGLV